MESLSRPFHSRKLSNATTTFSATNAYDGVFSGSRSNYPGASVIDSQDYREIFGSSPAAASIPVLDLSTLREPSGALNLNSNFRSSKPDYSNIFGGFRNEDVAVSYEELFARDKARAPSSTSSSSSDSDNFSRQSSDDLKQFNMSYNKISQKSKDGLDATRHVTQIHDTPGFTHFIDESIPPLMEAKKHESSPVHSRLDSSKQSKHQTIDFKFHASTVSSPDISENAPEVFSHFEEELDVNSAASASTVALKKAIEKAQESIRIAKESVGRKKKGLRSFSSKNFKDSLKVEGEEQKCKVEVKRVFERSQISSDVGWNRKYFNDSEKLSVAKKFIDEIHGKFTESTKENRLKDYTVVSNSTQGTGETKSRSLDSDEKDEHETFSSEVVETEKSRIEILDFLHVDELKENKDEVRISNAHELVEGFNSLNVSQKVEEDEKKVAQEEVLEQENIENSENTENDRENIDDEESDNRIQESKESLDNFSDQESEIKEESLDNFSDEEHDEILSGDDNVSIETELNDNNVETTQETDNCFEQIGTEENVVQSESSSSEEEEIPETEITNEAEKIADVTEQIKIEVVEKEQKGRIDEVAEREMEREKDRLAVDRAIREARERARERVERAAVEKATEEIRQRMMADAREKAAKVSAQSKLRAERVAVERATSEARQRALEKAMSQKSGTTSESALRSKAKLEKHNRIMERAAKALAEKEKRDLLAQKELAERNRLAENLDAEIKRWSSGKEGNLRALLTTLQYILGGESGWQAVTMPEIVATSAVKKAYRKATLCVHPDKLQQRRASIQQKYICEKVFDLLKAAWSKFNSEER